MLAIAARPGAKQPEFVDRPLPGSPGSGQVLCRTLQLGICGTDREILQSAQPMVPPGEEVLALGHECLARIVEVGPDVEGLQSGDLVVPAVRRGHEGCERVDMLPFGQYTERGIAFEHGFSQTHWLDEPRHLFPVHDGLTPVVVFTEPLSVTEKACNEALAVQQGRFGGEIWSRAHPPRVLVTGLGPIAFAGVLSAVARGWPVAVYGRDTPDSPRVEVVDKWGAQYITQDEFDSPPQDVQADGFDLIIECTGSEEVMLRSAAWTASCGVITWLAAARSPRPASLNVSELMRMGMMRNHIHLGSVNAAPRDVHQAIERLDDFYANRPDDVMALLNRQVPVSEGLEHYINRDKAAIKVVLNFD